MDGPLFEVELKLRVDAKTADGKAVFLLELAYAGLLQIVNVPDDVLQQVLLIEGPHMLFPFARRIIADVVRDGGMPPLMIEPIDFAGLYRSKAGADAADARRRRRRRPLNDHFPRVSSPCAFHTAGRLLPAKSAG